MARRILLGRIARAHGIRGEVLIESYAGAPEDIAAYGPLSEEGGTRRFALEVVRVTAKGVIARIAGIGDRTAAEALAGVSLWADRARLPPPGTREYYHADLIGLTAVGPGGERIGEIVAVQNYGAGDLVEIRLEGQRATELVPFDDAFVGDIDLAAARVVVVIPEAAGGEDEEG
jgi:16S rRNA processing protein RimM